MYQKPYLSKSPKLRKYFMALSSNHLSLHTFVRSLARNSITAVTLVPMYLWQSSLISTIYTYHIHHMYLVTLFKKKVCDHKYVHICINKEINKNVLYLWLGNFVSSKSTVGHEITSKRYISMSFIILVHISYHGLD